MGHGKPGKSWNLQGCHGRGKVWKNTFKDRKKLGNFASSQGNS